MLKHTAAFLRGSQKAFVGDTILIVTKNVRHIGKDFN